MNTQPLITKLGTESEITLLLGSRGSGKTATSLYLAQKVNEQHPERRIVIINYPQPHLLPKWIHHCKKIEDAPNNSLLLIDEAALEYGARDSMTGKNKNLADLLPILRHKDQSAIFATQNTALSDLNLVRLVDSIIVKKLSLLQLKTERSAMKDIINPASHKLKGKDKSYCYAIVDEQEGTFTHSLPNFWNNKISKGWQKNVYEDSFPDQDDEPQEEDDTKEEEHVTVKIPTPFAMYKSWTQPKQGTIRKLWNVNCAVAYLPIYGLAHFLKNKVRK